MLSARCPSCGAPVWFRHAVAAATVCENCRSTVVRNDADQLALAGVASVFPRDLSPISIGARGKSTGRGFVVVGVVRKARERARWSEWFCVFDDGKTGWLGEGNGQLMLFDAFVEVPGVPRELVAGNKIRIRNATWQILECNEARIVAADGELPYAASDDQPAAYAELRRGDGKTVGTLDHDFDPPRLYTGRLVTLKDIQLDPIRPFTGWSDPDLAAAIKGPEIEGARSLACPACTAPLQLHAPDAVSLVCKHCGSVIAIDDADPSGVVSRIGTGVGSWQPTLPLGARGRLEGIEWEVIGVMDRYVRFEGERFGWTEHFLFNPYHGYRWLAEDHGTNHWNFIERLPDLPERHGLRRAVHDGHGYRAFQQGAAYVDRVMGEFTWEIRAGDSAETIDFVDPPYMLSIETERNEQSASLGRWISADEVERAFPDAKLSTPRGIAPNQPNSYDAVGTQAGFAAGAILFTLATVGLFVSQIALSANESLLDWESGTRYGTQVSGPFVVADGMRRSLAVTLDTTLDPASAMVHLTLLNQDDGRAYRVDAGRTRGSTQVGTVDPGRYVVVAEGAGASPSALDGKQMKVKVIRDKPNFWPVLFGFGVVLLGPIWWFAGRTAFEGRRWQSSDF